MFIGNVEIKNKVVLAPMAGICNNAYRTIIKEMGCGLIVAEMVSDKAIVYNNEKTIDMLYMTDFERPLSQQIFGSDKNSFVESAKYIYEHMHPDIIDINMGCPVPKVALKSQAGSALLRNPKKVYEIVSEVVKSVPIPVTVKIRSGWDEKSINAVEIAKIIESAGASAITVHPRTRKQGYSGLADWTVIKQVKENVSIPVIGNGDITCAKDVLRMQEETGCDGFMIGRRAKGNPWIFKEILHFFETGEELPRPSLEEVVAMMLRHGQMMIDFKGEYIGVREMRKHVAWYTFGFPGAAKLREKVNHTETYEDLEELLQTYLKANPERD